MHRMALVEAERALEHWATDEDSLEGQGAVIWHTAQVLCAHGRNASLEAALQVKHCLCLCCPGWPARSSRGPVACRLNAPI